MLGIDQIPSGPIGLLIVVMGLLCGLVVIFFAYVAQATFRFLLRDRRARRDIKESDAYKALVDKYLAEGHRPSKAHDLAFRKLHRRTVRRIGLS